MPTFRQTEIDDGARKVLRIEATRDRDPGIRVEEDTPVDSDTSDRIRASYRAACKFGESCKKGALVAGAVGLAKDLPRAPNGQRCVPREKAEATDSINWVT